MDAARFSGKCAAEKAIMNKRKQETKENTGENRQKFIKFEKENNYVKFLLRTDGWPEIRQFRSVVWRGAGKIVEFILCFGQTAHQSSEWS